MSRNVEMSTANFMVVVVGGGDGEYVRGLSRGEDEGRGGEGRLRWIFFWLTLIGLPFIGDGLGGCWMGWVVGQWHASERRFGQVIYSVNRVPIAIGGFFCWARVEAQHSRRSRQNISTIC